MPLSQRRKPYVELWRHYGSRKSFSWDDMVGKRCYEADERSGEAEERQLAKVN